MPVQTLVVVRRDVPPRAVAFDPLQALRVPRHHVFDPPVLRALFLHPHFAVPLHDLRLDLAVVPVHQLRHRLLARWGRAPGSAGWRRRVVEHVVVE